MEPTIKSFYDSLAYACDLVSDCIETGRYQDVVFHMHDIMLLFDCIQRSNDQSFIQSIVKEASADVATEIANS
jgi:hypothetical protein